MFENNFLRIFSALVGFAFLIYWLQYFPVFSTVQKFLHSLFIKKNSITVDDLIEQQKREKIDEELKKEESVNCK